MSNVPMVRLAELMAKRLGSIDPMKFPDEVFALYSIPAFDSRNPEVVAGTQIGSTKQLVQADDVLLSKIVPHIRRSWIVGKDSEHRLIGSGEWIVFRSERALPAYLRHVLIGDPFHSQFMQTVSGVGGSLLRARPAQVAEIEIPLPSLPEQRRIAASLDKADALRTKRREALAQLNLLAHSIFVEMFGDPVTAASHWPIQPLSEVCSEINDCPHSTPEWTERGYVCLRTSNLTQGGWNWTDRRFVSQETYHQRSSRGYIKPGDIILSREGTVGIAAIIEADMQVCMGQRLVQVRPHCEKVTAEFLLHHLLYVLSPSRISRMMVGSTAQHLNVKELRALKTPVPPLSLQCDYSARLHTIRSTQAKMKDSLTEADSLFSSIQHRAFRGEL